VSRIIAGSLASRRFATPKGTTTRPTTDRVRESVFSYLASTLGVADRDPAEQLASLRFLDLFAGSGAMGLEAVSRGAEATWVDHLSAGVIRANCETLGVRGTIVSRNVGPFVSRESTTFDIVWMDPPYELPTADVDQLISHINDRGLVKSHGIVLVERSRRSSAVEFPESFLNVCTRHYGESVIYTAEMR